MLLISESLNTFNIRHKKRIKFLSVRTTEGLLGVPYNITDEMLDKTVFDKTNKMSFVNVFPDRLEAVLHRLRPKLPKVLCMNEIDLRKQLKPDDRDEKLRLAFWDEYNLATSHGKKMSVNAICRGLMSWETWYTVYEPSDRKMMWILNQPVSYAAAMRNVLHKSTQRLMEIVSLPILDEKGRPDSKVIVNILRAFQLVDMRVKGGIAQKVMIKQQSHHLHQSMSADQAAFGASGMANRALDVGSLDLNELEMLEKRISRARKDAKKLASTIEGQAMLLPANTAHRNSSEMPSLENDEVFTQDLLDIDVGDGTTEENE